MNQRHLSSRRMSAWVAGGATPAEQSHLAQCPECAAEVARFEAMLARFGDVARAWTAAEDGGQERARRVAAAVTAPVGRRATPGWSLRWAAIPVALLLVATIPLVIRNTGGNGGKGTTADNNTVLYEQVDTAVSQRVPNAMQPLMALVSWDAETAENGNGNGGDSATSANAGAAAAAAAPSGGKATHRIQEE